MYSQAFSLLCRTAITPTDTMRADMEHDLRLQLHYELDEDGDVPPGGGDALAKRPSVPTYLAARPLTCGAWCDV